MAVFSAISSIITSNNNKKAMNKASDASLAAAQENSATQKYIYGENKAALSPFMQRGNIAGDYLNAFLGLPSAPPVNTTVPTTPGTNLLTGNRGTNLPTSPWGGVSGMAAWAMQGGANGAYNPQVTAQAAQPSQAPYTPVTQGDARNAFTNWLNSSDYAYQSALGKEFTDSQFAGGGTLQSGAALKALQDRQNNINQGFQGNWMNALANQQGVGMSGASALAGVGQNFANSMTSINNNRASDIANIATARANNSNSLANGLIGAAQSAFGFFGGKF